MAAPRLRLTTNKSETVPLRFDDPEFIEALEADASQASEDSDGRGPLAILLGQRSALDYDFSTLAEDGWTLHARPVVLGEEADRLMDVGQKPKGGVDIGAYLKEEWATWIRAVSLPDETQEDMPGEDKRMLSALSSTNHKQRAEAFGKLPDPVRRGFRARLKAHQDLRSRPADRDPS